MEKPRKESADELFLDMMMSAYTGGSPEAAILRQEERGASQLREADSLPSKVKDGSVEDLKAMGFEVGEPFEHDPLFMPVKFPEGWKREPSPTNRYGQRSQNYWTHLIDPNGYVRAEIFYKAASYDRDAFMRLRTRYEVWDGVSLRLTKETTSSAVWCSADGDGVVIKRTRNSRIVEEIYRVACNTDQPISEATRSEKIAYYHTLQATHDKAKAWLEAHYPDYKSPVAYWD